MIQGNRSAHNFSHRTLFCLIILFVSCFGLLDSWCSLSRWKRDSTSTNSDSLPGSTLQSFWLSVRLQLLWITFTKDWYGKILNLKRILTLSLQVYYSMLDGYSKWYFCLYFWILFRKNQINWAFSQKDCRRIYRRFGQHTCVCFHRKIKLRERILVINDLVFSDIVQVPSPCVPQTRNFLYTFWTCHLWSLKCVYPIWIWLR